MSFAVEAHVLERLAAAPVVGEPFAHCVVDGVFPADFYEDIVDHWPQDGEFVPLTSTGRVRGAYEQRRVVLFGDSDLARLAEGHRA